MQSPAISKKNAAWYARNYYAVEDDIIPIFEKMDTPFLDARIKPGMRVLDAMMGRGRHAIRYAKRGCQVTGNDLNPHMVVLAKKAAKRMGVKATFLNLDARKFKGVPSNTFDVTIAMFSALGTIPGTKNRQQTMERFARVTKHGGLVIVHAHNRLDTFFEPDFWPWLWRTYVRPAPLETGDILLDYNGLRQMMNHFYTPGEMRASFRKAGLQVIEEHYMDYERRRFLTGPLQKLCADGFIFVGKKL